MGFDKDDERFRRRGDGDLEPTLSGEDDIRLRGGGRRTGDLRRGLILRRLGGLGIRRRGLGRRGLGERLFIGLGERLLTGEIFLGGGLASLSSLKSLRETRGGGLRTGSSDFCAGFSSTFLSRSSSR